MIEACPPRIILVHMSAYLTIWVSQCTNRLKCHKVFVTKLASYFWSNLPSQSFSKSELKTIPSLLLASSISITQSHLHSPCAIITKSGTLAVISSPRTSSSACTWSTHVEAFAKVLGQPHGQSIIISARIAGRRTVGCAIASEGWQTDSPRKRVTYLEGRGYGRKGYGRCGEFCAVKGILAGVWT